MDSGDEFFFHHFIYSSDDSPSDDEDLMVAALVVHDHIERQLPGYRGSIPGRAPNLNRNREREATPCSMPITLPTPRSSSRINFVVVFVWQGMCSVVSSIREGVVAHDPYFECKMDALASLDSPLTRNAPRPSACFHMEFQAI